MDRLQKASFPSHAVFERILQFGHRQGRWCDGVARAGLILLKEGTPGDVFEWGTQLDELEAAVRLHAGLDRAATA